MSEPALAASSTSASLRINNFDLIRLLAATQVVAGHLLMYFNDVPPTGTLGFLYKILLNLPGIPIFFVISGYLISLSWERSGSTAIYATNRFLRIFPALWLCLIVTIIVLLASGYLTSTEFKVQEFLRWIFWQSTIGQSYAIGMLQGFGAGVPNGSLWSIPIELQFYIAMPLIYMVLPKKDSKVFLTGIVLLTLATALLSEWMVHSLDITSKWGFRWRVVTCLPYIYMFLLGVLIQRLRHHLMPLLRNMFLAWLALYLVVVLGLHYWAGWPTPTFDRLGSSTPPVFVSMILAMTTISAAYTWPSLSKKILRGNDISYGVYIYHMVFINLVIYLEITHVAWQIIIPVVATYFLAVISWHFLERPALSHKRHTLRSDGPTRTTSTT